MYNAIKSVLAQGDYNLKDMLDKIDLLWAKNKLTNEEYEELVALARGGAKTEHSVDVFAKLEEMDRRISALEKSNTSSDSTIEEYTAYEVGKWYYTGDTCSFDSKNYICTAPEGVVCVWSPAEYPPYWEEVVK